MKIGVAILLLGIILIIRNSIVIKRKKRLLKTINKKIGEAEKFNRSNNE